MVKKIDHLFPQSLFIKRISRQNDFVPMRRKLKINRLSELQIFRFYYLTNSSQVHLNDGSATALLCSVTNHNLKISFSN